MNYELCFIAKRTDGLGERLRAIVNAIALSKVFDARFSFYWDGVKFNQPGHAIDVKVNIFDKDFIEEHHVNNHIVSKAKSLDCFFEGYNDDTYFCDQVVLTWST